MSALLWEDQAVHCGRLMKRGPLSGYGCRFLTELKPFSNVVVYGLNLNFAISTQVGFYRQPSSVQNSLGTKYQHVLLGRFLFMALGHFTPVHCSERTVWSLIRVISSLFDHWRVSKTSLCWLFWGSCVPNILGILIVIIHCSMGISGS